MNETIYIHVYKCLLELDKTNMFNTKAVIKLTLQLYSVNPLRLSDTSILSKGRYLKYRTIYLHCILPAYLSKIFQFHASISRASKIHIWEEFHERS